MNNNTERLARKWAERIMATPEREYAPSTIAAAEHILATTTPPTMADVEWDDDKHYMAEAECPAYGQVIMLFQERDTRNIFVDVFVPEWEECQFKFIDAANLTPTGKRYTLTEVQ